MLAYTLWKEHLHVQGGVRFQLGSLGASASITTATMVAVAAG